MLSSEPCNWGNGDAVPYVIEMRNGVGIGVNREGNAMFSGAAHQFVVEVQTIVVEIQFSILKPRMDSPARGDRPSSRRPPV
jgi:hypothetical protein